MYTLDSLPGINKEVFFTRDRKVFYVVPLPLRLKSGDLEVWCAPLGWQRWSTACMEPHRVPPLRGAWQLVVNLCRALPRVVLIKLRGDKR
jgi:hypothetical protein